MTSTPKGLQQGQSWLQTYQTAADELLSAFPRSRWPQLIEMLTTLGTHE